MLLYRIDFLPGKLVCRIEQKGSSRILYLDTLKTLTKEEDARAIAFLTKIHLRSPNVSRSIETVSFQVIEVGMEHALECLKLLSETKKLHYQKLQIQGNWQTSAKLHWKEVQEGCFGAFLLWQDKEIPIEACSKVFPGFVLWESLLFPWQSSIAWNVVELFLQGPFVVTGAQKKKFLEENPTILWKKKEEVAPICSLPELRLADATGCFANLWLRYPDKSVPFHDPCFKATSEEKSWESDLLEAGFQKKMVGSSHYYCPGDKVFSTLTFLLELGWQVVCPQGKKIVRSSGISWDVEEKNDHLTVQGKIQFQEKNIPVQTAMQHPSLWMPLSETHVGLLDRGRLHLLKKKKWAEGAMQWKKWAFQEALDLIDSDRITWDQKVANLVEEMKEGAKFPLFLPEPTFQGKLLPYQQKGMSFLLHLRKWGFSGLLADEMGLGKTVQVLAFFSHIRTNLPLLVVAPSSLVYQWEREIRRFLPSFSVYVHAGKERKNDLSGISGVIVTSYAVIRSDLERFQNIGFEAVVLDESNAIKTHSTQTAQSCFALQGKTKIALTGTPIENRFQELVSQFRFLMGDFPFSDLEALKKQTKPFILRRTKQEVEIDLPPKMEQIAWVEMTEEQKAVYEAYRTGTQEDLHSNMEVLEKILRLRQIALDPRLVGSFARGAKIDLLLEETAERKALVFSQFATMLEILAEELKSLGRKVFLLTGSTPPEERQRLVQAFEKEEEACVFLLSLKAGGVGLNLTSAEYVFLLDPWWNDAVEAQAIDRAHRIGQTKSVIVRRYVTPHSVEEKMLSLKEKKQAEAKLILEGPEFNWSAADLLHLLT